MLQHTLLRAVFPIAGRVAPNLAARWAQDLFFTPVGPRSSARSRSFLEAGKRVDVQVDGGKVAAWVWGRGPSVYLVHGWAGIGGQLSTFGRAFLADGFRVVTFDAPGHGRSEGRQSSIVHFARALRAVSEVAGEPQAVVAHSLGAAATTYALSEGLSVRRAVFLGPTQGPREWAERFASQLGVPAGVMQRMRQRTERWLDASWDDFDIVALAARQSTPLLVIHDRDDAEVQWSDGAAIAGAWPGARLVTTSGLGHRRILRDQRVADLALDFVRGGPVATTWPPECRVTACPRQPVSNGLCEDCDLERSLFFRDLRIPA